MKSLPIGFAAVYFDVVVLQLKPHAFKTILPAEPGGDYTLYLTIGDTQYCWRFASTEGPPHRRLAVKALMETKFMFMAVPTDLYELSEHCIAGSKAPVVAPKKRCKEHLDGTCDQYCRTCEKEVCFSCVMIVGKHSSHDIISIEEKVSLCHSLPYNDGHFAVSIICGWAFF